VRHSRYVFIKKEAVMANPFKRNQPVSYEIHGRTGKVTKGTGRFKAVGERGRCTIKAEDGNDVSVFIKHVQPLVGEAPPAPTAHAESKTTTRKSPFQTATKPAPRSAGRRAANIESKTTARKSPRQAATKPARRSASRRAAADFGQQLATIQEKLDAIMDRLALVPGLDPGIDPRAGDKPAQPRPAQTEAASAPDGHHAGHQEPLAA
jgi:hypothetical protein